MCVCVCVVFVREHESGLKKDRRESECLREGNLEKGEEWEVDVIV